MSVIGAVLGSLESMSQTQLLLAFAACIGYAFAQGNLLPSRGRRIAWFGAASAAGGFAFCSADWTQAFMLLGIALVGMGVFVALVWLTSRALGVSRAEPMVDPAPARTALDLAAPETPSRPVHPGEHAHSI